MMQRKASRDSRSLCTGSKSVGTLKDAKKRRCHIAGVQEVGGYEGGVDCEEDSYYEVNSHKSSAKQEGKRHVQDLYVNIPVHTRNNYGGNPAKNFEVESYKEDKEGEEEDDKAQHGASSQVQMRPDLAEISFEDLQKLRERVGIRRYERMAFKQLRNTGKKKIPKRINKNRPVEISAKQPVGVLRQVASVKKQESRDPRFSDMHGTFIPEIFNNNYAFLNDIKTYEKEVLQKELAKTKCPEKKTKMVEILQRMVDQEREQERQRQQEQRVQQAKELALKQLREGKTPHFYKRSELRNMEMAEKFESLQKLGKLDKFMKKRRQKNMQRARRLLPQNNY